MRALIMSGESVDDGRWTALGVLVFDILKGMIPTWSGYFLHLLPIHLGLIAIAACMGHIYPLFFHFRGGKGVATAFGAIATIGWDLTGIMAGTWLLIAVLSGYPSLGSIITALITPFCVWWFRPEYTLPVALLSCLILMRHEDNIQRLWRGEESRIWKKR